MTNSTIHNAFAEYIKGLMERERMSQNELARRSGVSQATISLFLAGRVKGSLEDVIKILFVLCPSVTIKREASDYILCKLSLKSGQRYADYLGHESNPLRPTLLLLSILQRNHQKTISEDAVLQDIVCFANGVGPSLALNEDDNKILRGLQLQSEVAERTCFA